MTNDDIDTVNRVVIRHICRAGRYKSLSSTLSLIKINHNIKHTENIRY